MHDPNFLAQAETPSQTEGGTTKSPETSTPAKGEAKNDPGATFSELLSELGDHRELSVGPIHIIDLPIILIDHGLHTYRSVEAMKEEGTYTIEKNHIYHTGTHQAPALDMSITSLVCFQWLSMLLLFLIFVPMARKYKKHGPRPLKGLHNAMEAVVIYVQEEIIFPNVGKAGEKLTPIFLTFFFFILTMNFLGLIPGGHSATGSLNVTAGLAIIAFFVIQLSGIFKNGLVSWMKHLTGGVPVWLWPIMLPVEILGLFTKPFALCVRLFANMIAGHVILLSLVGLVFVTAVFIPVTLAFSLFINILELLVAFIQAYVFTILTAVFAGIAMASHDDHGAHEPLADHDAGPHALAH